MNVLLVENDIAQVEIVRKLLSFLDCTVKCVSHGQQALSLLKAEPVELVVLDWQLPKLGGLDLLRWIRTHLGNEPAVLFLTNRTLEVDVATAFEAGADEYVGKPVREIEFAARVKALLRRMSRTAGATDPICVGEYTMDPVSRSISLRGNTIELTAKEYLLAAYLFNNLGKIISRELLGKLAWGRELDYSSRTIDTHIYRVRQKLTLCPENGLHLTSVYAHGYRLDAVGARAAA
jgi:two-component system OmpR family response regulator